MSELTVMCPEPMAPCPDCVEDAQHRDENMLIVYCPHHKAGGVYIVEAGTWSISCPHNSESEFKRSLYAGLGRALMGRAVVSQ